MFTVVIPTLWNCPRLKETLVELNNCEFVGEVILIDNTKNNQYIKHLPKVKHILEGQNTYVTASWNKGVNQSQYDKLLILNDDTWFNWGILGVLKDYVTPEIGMIGISKDSYKRSENGDLSLINVNTRPEAYACAFFIHKQSWIPIPEEMKIWGQDDWLFVKNRQAGKTNFMLKNFKVEGYISLTVDKLSIDPEIEKIKQNDLQLKAKYKLF